MALAGMGTSHGSRARSRTCGLHVRVAAALACLILPALLHAHDSVDSLLRADGPPPGVVFEIVEGDGGALAWALPRVNRLAARLHERFPGLPVVVVSHGREQFGLLAGEAGGPMAPLHAEARALHDAGISVHVCGTHAGWNGFGPEDFPGYVDVSPSGPAQIRDYRALGYVLIRLRRGE